MGFTSDEELKNVYALIEEGKLSQGRELLSKMLQYHFDNSEINFAHWCCSYWVDFINRLQRLEPYEQGEGLIVRWKSFRQDYESQKDFSQKPIYAMQKGIFTLALNAYESVKLDSQIQKNADFFRKRGLCLKKLGKYESDDLSVVCRSDTEIGCKDSLFDLLYHIRLPRSNLYHAGLGNADICNLLKGCRRPIVINRQMIEYMRICAPRTDGRKLVQKSVQ